MKKRFFTLVLLVITFIACFYSVNAKAESSYLSEEDARYFLAFIYNSDADHVTKESLADDIFYKMLTGEYSNNSTYELAAKAAFLSHMDARIIDTLGKANVAAKTSREYLIEYFSKNLDEDSTGLVTDIYKENVANSILELCGGDGVLELVETVTDVVDNPDKYLDDVKAISSAFAYAYGQNVASLYTYFDVALSNVYLKSTEGAYETAMAYTVLALKESNFMSFAAQLIPGIPSWEDWVDKMDYWAEFVHNMKGEVSAGNSSDFNLVVYHPNCDELEVKVLWYTGGQLYAPVTERERYVLQGWYLDEECTIGPIKNDYVPNEKVVYLYAKWEPRYFTIKFDSNCDDVADYTYELDRLNVDWYEPVMKRAGYIFNGWYWDCDCTNPVEGEFEVSGDMTFYAGWLSQYGYTVSNNKATISYVRYWDKDANGNNITDMLIPEKIGGYPVEAVDFDLYSRAITGITFPNSMTVIREWVFAWFTALKSIVINDGIAVIEEGAFARCSVLENVTFGQGLKTIGDEAFVDCSNLTDIDFPEALTSIGAYAFSGCGISEVIIPDSVTTVGKNAFGYCDNLKNVIIGKGVTSISAVAFEGSNAIENINVSNDNSYYTSVDGVLYNKDKTILYKYPAAKTATSFKVPETVTEIAESAFSACSALESIDISNVKTIGDGAFKDCKNLNSIDILNINTLGEKAFYGCEKLKAVKIPDAIEELKYATFYGCKALESISIPDGVKTIGSDCFSDCSSITEITIPESVTFMDSYIFYGCTKLSKVKLPSHLADIPAGLFGMCESLEEIEIPKTATSIGYGAFYGCKKLKNIDIPDSVTVINADAFDYCISLEKVVIPEGVTSISYMTFYGCESLKKLIIPASVNYIEFDNFATTSNLTEVYFMGTKEEWEAVYIDEYGNDYLNSADVICGNKVIAELSNIKAEDGKISGEVIYDCILEDTDVLVALYDGETFVKLITSKAYSNSEKTDIMIEGEKNKSYSVKVFFWDFADLIPKGKNNTATDL